MALVNRVGRLVAKSGGNCRIRCFSQSAKSNGGQLLALEGKGDQAEIRHFVSEIKDEIRHFVSEIKDEMRKIAYQHNLRHAKTIDSEIEDARRRMYAINAEIGADLSKLESAMRELEMISRISAVALPLATAMVCYVTLFVLPPGKEERKA